ncbi:hypothetical protein DSO57_1037918 [Entomophthora muscae]|uniref:Uncharacterized protein n=1 Tax=Entomophthora muscae TaxID=34485 RepID=A0ACC2S0Z9_9FUNG|nr:hypothetical protein DSO57_1037918 [Entomophthora muscae]
MELSEIISAADNLKELLCPDQEVEDIRGIRNKIAESLEKEENSLQACLENNEGWAAKQLQYQAECKEIEANILKIREDKVFDKLTEEEYRHKETISKYNRMNQDMLLKIESLEQEVNQLSFSISTTEAPLMSIRKIFF